MSCYAVVNTATDIVVDVLSSDPGAVADCRVVETDQLFVPSTLTHDWTESGGLFVLGSRKVDADQAASLGKSETLLNDLGFVGSMNADDIQTWLATEVGKAADLDALKAALNKILPALFHMIEAVNRGRISQ